MPITKEQVLSNLDEVKKYVSEIETEKNKKEAKKINIQIKNRFAGSIIFESEKTTWKEAVEEAKNSGADLREANLSGADLYRADLRGADLYRADLREADLREADLSGANLREADLSEADLCEADLREAELYNAKFYGKGGTGKLKKSQVPDFLAALGFVIEEL